MRKTLCVMGAMLAVCTAAWGLEFRGTTWLMTRDQVVASESGPIVAECAVQDQREIEYRSQLYGQSAVITYNLESDKLLSASYAFRKDLDHSAYDALRRDITSRSGPPAFEKDNLVVWRLERTEVALTHRSDGTTFVAFWEKSYFARINGQR